MISAVILTKNEENNIQDCIDSLKWCDEIIVIDDYSEDRTVEIAKKNSANIFQRELNDDFSEQRNFGLKNAKHDWVLFIDADERVSDALAFEISGAVMQSLPFCKGYYLKRNDVFLGTILQYGETASLSFLRLAKKDEGEWIGKVHEKWIIKGKTSMLNNPLEHFPHRSITDFLHDINFYTDLRARELHERKVKSSWVYIILYPKAKFFFNYFIKRGMLDGLPGLVFALFMSLHSFLVRAKLWLLWQKK